MWRPGSQKCRLRHSSIGKLDAVSTGGHWGTANKPTTTARREDTKPGESAQSLNISTFINSLKIREIARQECVDMLTNFGLINNSIPQTQEAVQDSELQRSIPETVSKESQHIPTMTPDIKVVQEPVQLEPQKATTKKLYSNQLAHQLTHEFESYAEVLQKNVSNRTVTFCDDNREINLNVEILKGELEVPVKLLLDTGAQRSFISQKFYDQKLASLIQKKQSYIRMYGVGGNELTTTGEILLDIQLGDEIIRQKFIIADIKEEGILGFDFCQNHQAEWRWRDKQLTLNSDSSSRAATQDRVVRVILKDDTDVPPKCEIVTSGLLEHSTNITSIGMVEPQESFLERYHIGVAAVVTEKRENSIPIRLMNTSEENISIRKHTPIAIFSPVEVLEEEKVRQVQQQDTKMTDSAFLQQFEEQLATLGEKDRAQFSALLIKYRGQFMQPGYQLGQTSLVKHEIHTGNQAPIKQRPRREPIGMQGVVKEELEKMLDKGIIEPSSSAWGSPIVLVRKKDNTVRFCIDYRKLNEVTTKDAYPLPRIEDNLDALQGSTLFSTLDLASGYWQVQMADQDKEKTAFSTKYGLYQFKVMPFGLCNAPGTFERLMETVLRGMQWERAVLYLDDIIVFSHDVQQHMLRLEEVFQRLKDANLTLKASKCKFLQQRVEFLGHIVDAQGIHTDPKKVEAVLNWETPKRVKDVRSFLGLTGYYRRFIKDYGKIAKPLHVLTEKEQLFQWTEETQEAFQKLKTALTTAPILGYPSQNEEDLFVLDTDASNCHIGGVLSQIQNGQERVIAFGSKVLSKAERNYCVTRRELLAVVHFCTQYKHYLIGRNFDVRTDHGALTWLFQFKQPEGQIARWLEILSSFQMNIIHRPGKNHSNGDGLSRRPCDLNCSTCRKGEKLIQDVRTCRIQSNRTNRGRTGRKRLRNAIRTAKEDQMQWLKDAQLLDEDLQEITSWTQRPEWEHVRNKSRIIKTYWSRWGQLRLQDGLWQFLWKRNGKEEWKWVLPTKETEKILKDYHTDKLAGHFGFEKSLDALHRSPYYVPRLRRRLSKFLQSCDICEKTKPTTKTHKAPMKKCIAQRPMERVAIDVMGPLPETTTGNKFIVVVADYFTKWTEAYAVPNHKAETIANKVIQEYFNRFGLPEIIHSDQGRDFESNLFQEMCQILEIQKTRTTPWHPQSDGMVERFNRTLETLLRQCVDDNQKNWDTQLSFCCAAYRSALHSTTAHTPNQLMMGREVPMPSHIIQPLPEKWDHIHSYNTALVEKLQEAHELARKNTKHQVHQYTEQYDKKSWQRELKEGTWVWLNNFTRKKGLSPKLQVKWEMDPYQIKKFYSEVVVEIQKFRSKKTRIVHLNKLKKVGDQEKWSSAASLARRDANPRVHIARRTHFPAPGARNVEL